MTPTTPGSDRMHARYRDWDAAYVLGALAPGERRAFEGHLAECDACRANVGAFAGMPGLLSMLTPEQGSGLVEDGAEPPSGTPQVRDGRGADVVAPRPVADLAAAVRRVQVRRRSVGVVAAGALVVGAALGGVALERSLNEPVAAPTTTSSPTPDGGLPPNAATTTVELTPVDGTGVSATLTATPTAWGTRLEWSCRYPTGEDGGAWSDVDPSSIVYELVLVDQDGNRTVAATWTATGRPEAWDLGASSAVPLSAVDRVEIAVVGWEQPLAAATL
jgi:Putative zinc-finger